MKDWFKENSNKRKVFGIVGVVIIILVLPITLLLVRQTQNLRSSAATPDKIETEAGVLGGAVTKLSDSLASGGQYVRFGTSQTTSPTPTPSQGAWGPRPAPPTPTGSNVYTVPSSIDGNGNSDVSDAINSFVTSVPDGSTIVFPKGKTYQLAKRIYLQDRNNLTLWGYGNTLRLTGPGNVNDSSAIRLRRADNIKIYGFRIKGNHTDMNTLSDGENQMGVYITDDSDNVEIADTYISDVVGDGIFVFVFGNPASDNWNFHHNLIENPGRQGITPNEGSGRIENNIIRGPGMYNIDAEDQKAKYPSNGGNKNLGPLVISNNWFDGWEQYNAFTPHVITAGYKIEDFNSIRDVKIENNLFTGGDLGTRSPKFGDTNGLISFWGTTPKTNLIIKNNTFDLPSDQRTGWAIRLRNVNGGEVSGNVIPGMTVQCSSCTNVKIQNNQ